MNRVHIKEKHTFSTTKTIEYNCECSFVSKFKFLILTLN